LKIALLLMLITTN